MRRINVCGTSATGKSTLSRKIAKLIDARYIELDALHHRANWEVTPTDEFRAMVAEAAAGESWVIDGTYAKARDVLWPRADTVIWLDYPLSKVFWRLTKRTLRRGLLREELWHGNRESAFRHFFTRDSLYLWVLRTHRKRRADLRREIASGRWPHLRFIRIASRADEANLLKEMISKP